jgi:hypothetical protein
MIVSAGASNISCYFLGGFSCLTHASASASVAGVFLIDVFLASGYINQ